MLAGTAAEAQDPRRLAGGERYIEALERVRKSLANRLDESLLARPAVEESERPVARGKGKLGFVLPQGKAARGDLVGIRQLAYGFAIDADLALAREPVHRDVLGMGPVGAPAAAGQARRRPRLGAAPR